ncbi:hypothetical protein [Mesorhizobium sp. M2A.F.Ca.ET.067.02.1.1]|uniref:hypothetical protein n=1 Tax=Mesorhizobium sp. M2A.F.Ca.ET.067.02.1.1 TaxID=2496749 RepID=UPI000FD5EBED|nr:hypothetical protein [Mesorhizobium sp. M2A.F.Ca.ET.067.02.1.1]RUW69834.1 hypothetical protein EOA28_24800 [Mesorhizobium sp. M2A.F.Ca.ET.067.02.1.1]
MNERLNRVPVREAVTVPVFHTEPRQLCSIYPHCECEADCIGGQSRRRAQTIFLAGVALTVAIGGGVILWSFFL